MLEKLIDNNSPYFRLDSKNARYRIALSSTILCLTFAKVFVIKGWAAYYRELPNNHIKNGEADGFYDAAFLSMAASGLWIFLDYISARLKSSLAESLKEDIYADICSSIEKPKVALVLKSKYPKVAQSLSQLLVSGLADYSVSLVDSTLGLVTQSVDFATSAYNFSQRSDRNIYAICFTSSALMTVFSFYLTQGSREIAKSKSEYEQNVRRDVQNLVDNSYNIVSNRAEKKEAAELNSDIMLLSQASTLRTALDSRNLFLNWWMTDLSSRILSTAMAPLVFAKQISFQTDFFLLNRELYQVRSFVLWICGLATGNFCHLNDSVYNTRTALDNCVKTIASCKLVFDNKANLRINRINLKTPDGKQQILDLNKNPVELNPGVYLLSGANGSGKTTFLNALAGLSFDTVEGSISIVKDELKVYVPQIANHKNGIKLLDLIVYPKTIGDFAPRTPTKIREEIGEMLMYFKQADLAADLDQVGDWNKKSGGQKQILLLIKALIRKPKVLFLDEVTSAMSAEIKHLAKTLIKKYAQDNKAIIIHIEHGGRNDKDYYTHKLSIAKKKLEVQSLEVKSKKGR